MGEFIGLERPQDDVALLVVRRDTAETRPALELSYPALASSLEQIRAAARRWLVEAGATPAEVTDLLLAVGGVDQ